MSVIFADPLATLIAAGIRQLISMRVTVTPPSASFRILWTASLNGAAPQVFGNGDKAVLNPPSSVAHVDAAGNCGVDILTIVAKDQFTMQSATTKVLLVNGTPFINHTNIMGKLTDSQPIPGTTPQDRKLEQGPRETTQPRNGFITDEENEKGEGGGSCTSLSPAVIESGVSQAKCETCGGPDVFWPDGGSMMDDLGGATPANVATPAGGNNAGVLQGAPMYCAETMTASASQAWTRPYGVLQFKSGCGALVTRGKPVELCTWFANLADGLVSAERVAGLRTMFGWQARLIQDTTGHVAIYWGNRSIEPWFSPDGGAHFSVPNGNFGTLTKQGGAFTRTTKDATYYDFDSNGRLQTIKDRSVDGNVIYYNYNGSNQVIRITGPGLGYQPYFTYDANNRVNAMTLESSDPSKERVTYYDYDGTGRLNKVIWPENCITYFDYDGNNNLSQETNPDNYITYFTYGAQSIPRIQEINLPQDAAVYYNYNDGVPKQVVAQADGTTKTTEYQWAGLGNFILVGSEASYFSFDANAKPTFTKGTDDTLTYYTWDGTGQMKSMRTCEDTLQYFTYGTLGRTTSWKDALGKTTYWNYDANGNQTNWIDRLGHTTYFERDNYGKITSAKDRRGNVTYYTYNNQGLVTSQEAADLTVKYFDYNPGAELEVAIDELANVAYYDHDGRGRITVWKDFLAQETSYGYDNRSNLTVMVDRRGNAWYYEYDGLSRRNVARTALLNTSYFNYARENVLESQIDPLGNETTFTYTAEKRLESRENALGETTYFTYTNAGQLESVQNARGCTTYYTYDCHHRKNSMMDAVGNVTYYDYDADNDQTTVTDPRGNTSTTSHDDMERVISREDALGRLSYFYYDEEGNQTCAEDALQRRTYFYFDDMDRRYCVEDALKNLTYFTYEARGMVSSQKNARGFVTYMYYDNLERPLCTRDARNGLTYIGYDENSNRTSAKDQRGNVSEFTYDDDNRNVTVETPLGEVTTLGYDIAANRTSVEDARGNISYFYFDALNRLYCSEDAKHALSYLTYDAAGNTNSQQDPLGRVTYHDYDCDNRRITTTDALQGVRSFTYDPASNNDTVTNPRGFVTNLYYDELNRVFAQETPVGGLTYFDFDEVGNRVSVKDPVDRLNYFYFDEIHRQYASEDGLQERTYFEFDEVGNTVSIKNARREPDEVGIQYFTYDELNRRNSAEDEVGKVWYYDYDSASNLQVQTNPRLALTYWEYDSLNRKQSQKDALSRSWYWTYDAVGNVSSVKDGKAATTYYQYDEVNLLDRVDYPDANHDYFEYDPARQRTAMADQTGRTEWQYDDLARNTYRLNPGAMAQELYYEYDADSNRITLKDPDGILVYYDWDEADRMKEVSSQDYAGSITYYEFNPANQVVHEVRVNGTITYYGYDGAGRIGQLHHRTGAAAVIENWDFTRDEAGNPILIAMDDGSSVINSYFNYDQANRIAKEAWRSGSTNVYGFLYTYDEAGNRTIKKHTAPSTVAQYWEYDLADQLEKQRDGGAVGVYFEFDDNGNMAVEHDVTAGRTYYDYEPRNLVSRIDFPGAVATNYFLYNGVGERIRKQDSTGGKIYTWDGIDVILEKDLALASVNRYVKGFTPVPGIGPHVMIDPGAVLGMYFPHKNQVGSTLRVTDNTGTITNTYKYDAWGQPFETTESVTYQNRFNGKELDPDFILTNSNNRRQHYPARTYVPFRAEFIQVDPLNEFLEILASRKVPRKRVSSSIVGVYTRLRWLATVKLKHPHTPLPHSLDSNQLQAYLMTHGNPTANSDPDGWHGHHGCGGGETSDSFGDRIVRDDPAGFNFYECCHSHDHCYADCKKPKEQCDNEFYDCMIDVVEANADNFIHRIVGELLAELYWGAVHDWGWLAYKCCPPQKPHKTPLDYTGDD